MTIVKHLVLTGGGPVGLVEYGALKYLTEKNYIIYENIKSIYSISIGGIIGLIYILKYDWTWMDDFLIKRPWNKLFNITYSSYMNILFLRSFAWKIAYVCGSAAEKKSNL